MSSIIHELANPIKVHTPLGCGKAIAWIDYGVDVNTVWKVVFYEDGKVRNISAIGDNGLFAII
jgi:hypothetical protein